MLIAGALQTSAMPAQERTQFLRAPG